MEEDNPSRRNYGVSTYGGTVRKYFVCLPAVLTVAALTLFTLDEAPGGSDQSRDGSDRCDSCITISTRYHPDITTWRRLHYALPSLRSHSRGDHLERIARMSV